MPLTDTSSTLPIQPDTQSKMQSVARAWPQNNFGPPTASSRAAHPFTASSGINLGSDDNAQAAFQTSQGISFDPSAGVQLGLLTGASQMTTAAVNRLDHTLAQQRRQQTQWQQRASCASQSQLYKQQWTSMGQQPSCQQVQGHALARHHRQHPRSYTTPARSQHVPQHLMRQFGSPLGHATLSPPPTPQESFEQLSESVSSFATHSQIPKSIASHFLDTNQQSAPQTDRPATLQPLTAINSLTTPRLTPPQFITTAHAADPYPVKPQLQAKVAVSAHAEAALRNERVERIRLLKELRQERKRQARRREMVAKDTTALYHNYSEVLEYFPLRRGERPNPYLNSLLANQPLPAEPTTDCELAILYAKKHWEYYWELKDLDYVVKRAKEDNEKNTEERKRVNTLASVARRR